MAEEEKAGFRRKPCSSNTDSNLQSVSEQKFNKRFGGPPNENLVYDVGANSNMNATSLSHYEKGNENNDCQNKRTTNKNKSRKKKRKIKTIPDWQENLTDIATTTNYPLVLNPIQQQPHYPPNGAQYYYNSTRPKTEEQPRTVYPNNSGVMTQEGYYYGMPTMTYYNR